MKPLEPPVQREGERAGEHEDVRERRRALRSVRQQRSVHAEHHGEHAQALDCLDGLSTLRAASLSLGQSASADEESAILRER